MTTIRYCTSVAGQQKNLCFRLNVFVHLHTVQLCGYYIHELNINCCFQTDALFHYMIHIFGDCLECLLWLFECYLDAAVLPVGEVTKVVAVTQ